MKLGMGRSRGFEPGFNGGHGIKVNIIFDHIDISFAFYSMFYAILCRKIN